MLWALEGHTKPETPRQPADDPYDPMSDPLLRDLKRIIPYHPMWQDPEAVAKFAERLHGGQLPPVTREPTHSVDIAQQTAAPPDGRNADHEFLAGVEGAKKWMRGKTL